MQTYSAVIMKNVRFSTYFLLFINTISITSEYIYPIAYSQKIDTTLLMHQNASKKLNLLFWDHAHNSIYEGLWSLFNPTNVQLLPDESGFSFIDNGRLRIKYFNKRSAKTIDFDQYIYGINSIIWITSQQCVFGAKYTDYYSIFLYAMDDNIKCVASNNQCHCLYPRVIENTLFYVQETTKISSIHSCNLTNPEQDALTLIDFDNKILFLNMLSHKEGFVVEYVKSINHESKNIYFYYTYLIKINDVWTSQRLFSFYIPLCLLSPRHENFLYESLTPLIPRVIGTKIYFVSADKASDDLKSYTFDLITKEIIGNNVVNNNYFVPILGNEKLIFGGQIHHTKDIITHPF